MEERKKEKIEQQWEFPHLSKAAHEQSTFSTIPNPSTDRCSMYDIISKIIIWKRA